MTNEKKCFRCGGTNVVPTEVQSTGKIYARPDNAKPSTILTGGVLIRGDVCFDCGSVGLLVDAEKVRAVAQTT